MEIKISDLIREHGLPEKSVFLGFVVYIPKKDEFLADVSYHPGYENRMWSKIPDLAKIYTTQKKAEKEIKRYGKDACVGMLLDSGDQYIVMKERQ
jgi:hypothetical protein